MNEKAKYYIQKLQLQKHPEGGYFKEIYRSGEMITIESHNKNLKRNYSTSIYFLLEGSQVSKFHRLKFDELWHFYDGSSVKIYQINKSGDISETLLGKKSNVEEHFQITIEKNNWFAAEVVNKKSFALIGCTVAPGFDFADLEISETNKLIDLFPAHADLIKKLNKSK